MGRFRWVTNDRAGMLLDDGQEVGGYLVRADGRYLGIHHQGKDKVQTRVFRGVGVHFDVKRWVEGKCGN